MRRLLNFFRLGANEAVIIGVRRALGYQQLDSTALGTAIGLTIPTVTAGNVPGQAVTQIPPGMLIMQCNGGTVRWRDDGTAPDASTGMLMVDGVTYTYFGDITKIKFITATSTPKLEASLYGGV